ncbi:MAG: hypothetical protein AAFP83_12450 [Bacteroidota bacterium]
MKELSYLSILCLILSSCCNLEEKDFLFSQEQYQYLAPYKENDTLYFHSSELEVDTIVIYKIDSARNSDCGYIAALPASNDISITINHLYEDEGFRTVQDVSIGDQDTSAGDSKRQYQPLIGMSKYPQSNKVKIGISFKNFYAVMDSSLGEVKSDTVIEGVRLSDCYKIKHDFPETVTSDKDIEEVYWTSEYGLTAYRTKKGTMWVRKQYE